MLVSQRRHKVQKEGKCVGDSQARTVPRVLIISDNSEFRRFPLPQRTRKYVTKTSFPNESNTAAIGAPVRSDGSVNLYDI